MNWLPILILLVIAFFLGLGVAFLFKLIQGKVVQDLAEELFRKSEAQGKENIDTVIENLRVSFGNLALDALSKTREIGLKDLHEMGKRIENGIRLIQEEGKDREKMSGEITNQLKTTNEQTVAFMSIANAIREALASPKIRGQWGERMAEDVLRVAGFIENVNYFKQKATEDGRSRPDFTFLLPNELKVNMDVKFPLDNYMKFLEANSPLERMGFRNKFLRDVKAKIKEVTSREYINPQENTVDCVLLFIPNERVFAFIYEEDSSLMDEGLKNRVVLCSPISLFAVLAVIRQAVKNFSIQQTSNEVLSLLGEVQKKWNAFVEKMELLGKRLEDVQEAYDSLTESRKRQLERPLNKIENLITHHGLPTISEEKTDPL